MISLKQQTISGISWSLIDNIYAQGLTFLIGLILARILSPHEFGLIGLVTVFIALGQVFVESGFLQALIQKSNCSDEDYNTVFVFNIIVAITFYIILFSISKPIANFFKEDSIEGIIKIISITIIFNSIGLVQAAQLTKKVNIKIQTKISIISNSLSGAIAITMAFTNYGIWSLVFRIVSLEFIRTVLLWYFHKWRPNFSFNLLAFRNLFMFGSKLLFSGLLNTLFENIYYFVIGKYFSASQLGFYTRALGFANIPSFNISKTIQKVSFPIMAKIKDDPFSLRKVYFKLMRNTMFLTFLLMIFLAASAKSIIIILIGPKWEPSIIYLQLLSLSLLFHPLHSLNLNIINVKGRSDLYLRIELFKKLLIIPIIIIGILYGIKILLIGMIFHSILCLYINSKYIKDLLEIHFIDQIKELFPSFFLAIFMGLFISIPNLLINDHLILLSVQSILAIAFTVIFGEILQIKAYLEIKGLIFQQIFSYKFILGKKNEI